jgi:hypothetical protein
MPRPPAGLADTEPTRSSRTQSEKRLHQDPADAAERELSGVSLRKRMKQISCGKQRKTKNSAPEIKVMTNAMLGAPPHPRKQIKCFADMGKDNYNQTCGAEQLEESAHSLFSKEQDDRTREQHARRHQRNQSFK